MRYEEKEVEVECPKCKSRGKGRANNFFDTIYSCSNCGEVICIKKISIE